jgi:hypothetical protein
VAVEWILSRLAVTLSGAIVGIAVVPKNAKIVALVVAVRPPFDRAGEQ